MQICRESKQVPKSFSHLLGPLFLPLHSKEDTQLGFLNQDTSGPDVFPSIPHLPYSEGQAVRSPSGDFLLNFLFNCTDVLICKSFSLSGAQLTQGVLGLENRTYCTFI